MPTMVQLSSVTPFIAWTSMAMAFPTWFSGQRIRLPATVRQAGRQLWPYPAHDGKGNFHLDRSGKVRARAERTDQGYRRDPE